MPLLYPTSCKCSTESFVNSASPFPLLFFLEEKKQKKVICGTGFPAAPAAFAGLQHKNGQLACERPFFVPRRMCEKRLFYACYPQPLCLLFLFFKKRNRSPSFLFRRKEAKESHLRNVYFPLLLTVSPTCSTKRTAHIRAGRFFCCKLDVRENAFCPKCTPQPLRLLFLFFKKRNRSPSFLFRRKEAKENHLPDWFFALLCAVCAILLHKTDGSHTSRPFFLFQAGCAESRLLSEKPPQPLCLLFLFFKKRNRPPSFLFRRKEIVP